MKKLFLIILLFPIQYTWGQIISTYAGNGNAGYYGDGGLATNAEFKYVGGITCDNSGNLFICDLDNNRVRKVDSLGIITTFAGNGGSGFSGDNGLAINAAIHSPQFVAFDVKGNLYISDFYNNRIRKVDTAGIITTFAGNGLQEVSGDNGLATLAGIGVPDGIAFDGIGNLYISEGNFDCVRKIDTAGIITTIAGIPDSTTYNGDGIQATLAHLNFPAGIAIDSSGNIFITEHFGERIRKIDNLGIIHTIAGTGVAGYNGDNILAVNAQINRCLGLAFDLQWNLYFADGLNSRIRKIDTFGIITTVAGSGVTGFGGDGGLATLAKLYYPVAITFDSTGNMFIADDFNNRVREVKSVSTGIFDVSQIEAEVKIYPNPIFDKLIVTVIGNEQNEIFFFDLLSREILQQKFTNSISLSTEQLAKGIYLYELRNKNGVIKQGKVVKD